MIAGLTGGIGSGKSIVARLFAMLGCAVFNSDQEAASVYFDKEVKTRIISLLGPQAYSTEGTLNKAYISERIFSDDKVRLALNAIIHPEVGRRFRLFANQNKNKVIIKETALLFEAGIDKQVDKIIVVTAPEHIRISRIMLRDNLSCDEIAKKIKSQLPEEEKISKADYVITNDEKEFLITQVLRIHAGLLLNV